MRISDWSSDVCSSDLIFGRRFPVETGDRAAQRVLQPGHIDGNALVTRPRSALNQRRAQERQTGGSSLCDIPGEIVPVPTFEEAPPEQSMELARDVGRQTLISHFIVGRNSEIGGIFARAGGRSEEGRGGNEVV